MADISKITLPSGTTYDLKDANALRVLTEFTPSTFSDITWSQGSISYSDGTIAVATNRLYTSYLPPSVAYLTTQSGFRYTLAAYDYDNTYMGMWTGSALAKSETWNTYDRTYNLLDVDNIDRIKYYIVVASGTATLTYSTGNVYTLMIPCTAGKTYTFSRKNATSRLTAACGAERWDDGSNHTLLNYKAPSSNDRVTITAPEGATYLYIFYYRGASDSSYDDTLEEAMITEGSTVLPYKPYRDPNATTPAVVNLTQIGNYKFRICLSRDPSTDADMNTSLGSNITFTTSVDAMVYYQNFLLNKIAGFTIYDGTVV